MRRLIKIIFFDLILFDIFLNIGEKMVKIKGDSIINKFV